MFRKNTIANSLRVACDLAQVAASRWMTDAPPRRLRQLLRHAFDNVPYYRRLFAEAGARPEQIRNFSELSRLPLP
jgi:phenylacetate-CoA ligase